MGSVLKSSQTKRVYFLVSILSKSVEILSKNSLFMLLVVNIEILDFFQFSFW